MVPYVIYSSDPYHDPFADIIRLHFSHPDICLIMSVWTRSSIIIDQHPNLPRVSAKSKLETNNFERFWNVRTYTSIYSRHLSETNLYSFRVDAHDSENKSEKTCLFTRSSGYTYFIQSAFRSLGFWFTHTSDWGCCYLLLLPRISPEGSLFSFTFVSNLGAHILDGSCYMLHQRTTLLRAFFLYFIHLVGSPLSLFDWYHPSLSNRIIHLFSFSYFFADGHNSCWTREKSFHRFPKGQMNNRPSFFWGSFLISFDREMKTSLILLLLLGFSSKVRSWWPPPKVQMAKRNLRMQI